MIENESEIERLNRNNKVRLITPTGLPTSANGSRLGSLEPFEEASLLSRRRRREGAARCRRSLLSRRSTRTQLRERTLIGEYWRI